MNLWWNGKRTILYFCCINLNFWLTLQQRRRSVKWMMSRTDRKDTRKGCSLGSRRETFKWIILFISCMGLTFLINRNWKSFRCQLTPPEQLKGCMAAVTLHYQAWQMWCWGLLYLSFGTCRVGFKLLFNRIADYSAIPVLVPPPSQQQNTTFKDVYCRERVTVRPGWKMEI